MSTIRFDGNEPLGKVMDTIKGMAQALYQPEITITTTNGSHAGRLIEKGSVWIVLESKTGRKPVGGSQEVLTKTLIATNSVVAITFETLG